MHFHAVRSKNMKKICQRMRLSIALFLAMLLFAVLAFASCDFRAISDETTFSSENANTPNISDCDQVGHIWGRAKGDPYADASDIADIIRVFPPAFTKP